MAPRSTHRTLVLAATLALSAYVAHDAVPHEGLHTALAQHAPTNTPTATPTNTPHSKPTNTSTATPMPSLTATNTPPATSTATQTATPTIAPPATATASPTATSTPSAVGADHPCNGGSLDSWHGTLQGNTQCQHEHGDPPPPWIAQAGYQVAYSGPFNTSPIENALGPNDANPTRTGKHNAMKGMSGTAPDGIEWYVRYHAASNVHDRMSRFHSYEAWLREPNGKVTHSVGWTNSGVPSRIGPGNQGAGGRRNFCSNEVDIRPEIEVKMRSDTCQQNEFWYLYAIGYGPTLSILIESTTYMYAGEYAEPALNFWDRTGALGTARELGLNWYAKGPQQESDPRVKPKLDQVFWATQFQETVSGPTDPRCSGTTVFPANPSATIHPFDQTETYQNVCLPQFVSSTAPFINTTSYREYSQTGIRLPN
jgi:hypothetical protein